MPIRDWSQTAASNTTIEGISVGEGAMTISDFNNALRAMAAAVREVQAVGTIASAATMNIGAANAEALGVTGTTTITAFDNVAAGVYRTLRFAGALTWTHNATSMILPTGANIAVQVGDIAGVRSLGSGNWRCESYMRASGVALTAPGSGVTSITASTGLSGGTITTTGTIALDVASLTEDPTPDLGADYVVTHDASAGGPRKAPFSVLAAVPAGALMQFAGAAAPTGWLLCYGQAVSRSTYAALFAVCGTSYGVGDGSSTFNVPDLRGRIGVGKDDMGGVAANRITSGVSGFDAGTLGAAGGSQSHTLSQAEMPSHTHTMSATIYVTGGGTPNGLTSDSGNAAAPVTIGSAGSNGAHRNVQPSIVVAWIIKI